MKRVIVKTTNYTVKKLNKHILHKDVQDFINQNLKTDITKLVLKGSPFHNVSIQELAVQITSKIKCDKKLPTWFATKNIYYPNKLNIEQTSSEITANYKASLIKGEIIIDVTGGFGVDSVAFSKSIKQVFHCEINSDLSNIAKHNFNQLQISNIKIIPDNGIGYIKNNNTKYDCIYIDPSRRDDLKKRVFFLQDCIPNLPENLALLFKYSNIILIKTAPLLDISAAINELNYVKEVHLLAVNNDVKEVLYFLENNYSGKIYFKTINFSKENKQLFNFEKSLENASYSLPKRFLFEPNAAILKAGAFSEISTYFSLYKLHKNSHLYTSSELINFPGRVFEILQLLPYHPKKIIKAINSNKANISIRNFPDSVAQIRNKTKLKDGGNIYLFLTTNLNEEKIVLVCKKV